MNLPKLLAQNLKRYGGPIGVKPATLVKVTPGTRTPGAVSSGTNPTTTSYPCTALISVLTAGTLPETEVQVDDRRIVVLGGSLASGVIPAPNDKVTIADVDGVAKTFRLVAPISGDGVGAAFAFQARRT